MLVKNDFYNDTIVEKAVEESFRYGKVSHSYFYKDYSAVPEYRAVILTCMDCRIISNIFGVSKPGKAIFLRTAGALFTSDVLRSLLIAIYELNVEFIAVVGHNDCGGKMSNLKMKLTVKKIAEANNLTESDVLKILGKNSAKDELLGFTDETKQIIETVSSVKTHSLIPKNITVSGYLYDHSTGKISKVA